jgi:hypothetical protein
VPHIRSLAAIVAGVLLGMPAAGIAKPISYVGGTMLMQENDASQRAVGFDTTITPNMAVAFHVQEHTRGSTFVMLGPQLNFLVRRWNLPDGQGNIFAMTGAGTTIDRGDMRLAAWTGVLADYETRRLFASYEARLMYAKDVEKSAWQRARLGIAPYLANYDEINTWLMVQVDRYDEKHFSSHHLSTLPATDVTPLVRIMFKTFMMEGGVSVRGKVMFNWIQQF